VLPIAARRIDYVDGTSDETSGVPARKTGVRGVIYWHNEPYRTFDYGNDTYVLDAGGEIAGETESDETHETWRQGIHGEAHKNKPPYARVAWAQMQVTAPTAVQAIVTWAQLEINQGSGHARVTWAAFEPGP
jgi:monoamine oxidase